MGDELKWLLKEGVEFFFESYGISLENTPILHAVSLALVICPCTDSAMPLCHVFAYNKSKWCLPLFVSHSSCNALVLSITAWLWHIWVGMLLREKHPLQQIHLKKSGGCIFEGGLIFRRWRYSETSRSKYKHQVLITILPVYHAHHVRLELDNSPGCVLPLLPIHPDHSPWRVTSKLIVETILQHTLWGWGRHALFNVFEQAHDNVLKVNKALAKILVQLAPHLVDVQAQWLSGTWSLLLPLPSFLPSSLLPPFPSHWS